MISVLILTYNEENNIRRCLESVAWSDDIVVLDSFSSDSTIEIAKEFGARIFQRKFDNELNQRLFSINEIEFKYDWVYNPDADEVADDELIAEMNAVARTSISDCVAYRVRFKTIFLGQWLRYSSLYPTWVVRFFQPTKIGFSRSINLNYHVLGAEGRFNGHFLHYTFNNGFDAWFQKHNNYSRWEALECLDSLEKDSIDWGAIFSRSNSVSRRRALKELSFRLPFRASLRFLYMYIFRLGFLDGYPGYVYCRMLAIYEYMIVLKVLEERRRRSGSSI